jgi:hypothetical protein
MTLDDFERHTAWVEEHDRQQNARADAINAEYRKWAQAGMDREYHVQTEILTELRRIKVLLRRGAR